MAISEQTLDALLQERGLGSHRAIFKELVDRTLSPEKFLLTISCYSPSDPKNFFNKFNDVCSVLLALHVLPTQHSIPVLPVLFPVELTVRHGHTVAHLDEAQKMQAVQTYIHDWERTLGLPVDSLKECAHYKEVRIEKFQSRITLIFKPWRLYFTDEIRKTIDEFKINLTKLFIQQYNPNKSVPLLSSGGEEIKKLIITHMMSQTAPLKEAELLDPIQCVLLKSIHLLSLAKKESTGVKGQLTLGNLSDIGNATLHQYYKEYEAQSPNNATEIVAHIFTSMICYHLEKALTMITPFSNKEGMIYIGALHSYHHDALFSMSRIFQHKHKIPVLLDPLEKYVNPEKRERQKTVTYTPSAQQDEEARSAALTTIADMVKDAVRSFSAAGDEKAARTAMVAFVNTRRYFSSPGAEDLFALFNNPTHHITVGNDNHNVSVQQADQIIVGNGNRDVVIGLPLTAASLASKQFANAPSKKPLSSSSSRNQDPSEPVESSSATMSRSSSAESALSTSSSSSSKHPPLSRSFSPVNSVLILSSAKSAPHRKDSTGSQDDPQKNGSEAASPLPPASIDFSNKQG